MKAFVIYHLVDGSIEPNHEKRQGLWATRATALTRIRSHWHCPWDWRAPNLPGEDWKARSERRDRANQEWKAANPFNEWWPKHYKIVELCERSEQ